ncbi:MAG: SDR family oxidoreductase [Bacteroidia bacterium]
MGKEKQGKQGFPEQQQEEQPGKEHQMHPRPEYEPATRSGCARMENKIVLITGGDSGIGRATCIAMAREGADIVCIYLNEDKDARKTKQEVEEEGRKCFLIKGDVGNEQFCRQAVKKTIEEFGKLDVVINNAAEQHPQEDFLNISAEQMEKTFRTNIFSMFYITQAALPHLKKGAAIVNTSSVTAYRGSWHLIDYASTKGAIIGFTRSLSANLAEKGIRVNAVAPGPIWTPLIPSTFPKEKVEKFGTDSPMGRAGQPEEVAPCFVFLACDESSYITGQVLHPNGGEIIGG